MIEETRRILHIDMNAFYCACHAADEPAKYRGKSTAVAGSPETRHGIVVTASYEARRRGVRATMTVQQALRLDPSLILIRPNFDLYRTYSRRAFAVVTTFTPLVEIFSIDECWADVTGSWQFGDAVAIAEQIQHKLREDIGLPCSIGVASNKFLAKMASDLRKPMGITTLWADELADKLWPQPVGAMFGIGGKTAERLERLGIHTIGQLAQADASRLQRSFGKRGSDLVGLARGIDNSPVHSESEPLKSVGHSITLSKDTADPDELSTVLLNLSDQVGRRMRRHHLAGRTVNITIRYGNRQTITRAKTLPQSTLLTEEIFATARGLLLQHRDPGRPIRLLGVSVSQLGPLDEAEPLPIQLSLFEDARPAAGKHGDALIASDAQRAKLEKLTHTVDTLRDKFGEEAVIRGRMMKQHESADIRDRKSRGTSLQKDTLRHDDRS